jgi:methionine-gamma-lyase
MSHPRDGSGSLRLPTEVLTRGFDPSLSFGSARPAVFRSSTYVFASPEAAERAFNIGCGRIPAENGQRADLIYSRISHPNAEILEDQMVPLERARQAAVFNSGMAAITTAFFTFARPASSIVYTIPLYGGTMRCVDGRLIASASAYRFSNCSSALAIRGAASGPTEFTSPYQACGAFLSHGATSSHSALGMM